MYPARDAREMAILLRIARDLDVVGDVTATVDNPSELLAWALILEDPEVVAWRGEDSRCRYLQVTAVRNRAPIRGQVTAVLPCDQHQHFWNALGLEHLAPGERRAIDSGALSAAWEVMPVTPPATSSGEPRPERTQ